MGRLQVRSRKIQALVRIQQYYLDLQREVSSSFDSHQSLLRARSPGLLLYDAQYCNDPFSRIREEKSLGRGGDVEGRQVAVKVKGFRAVKFVHHESRQLKQRYSLAAHNQMDELSIRLIDPNSGPAKRRLRLD